MSPAAYVVAVLSGWVLLGPLSPAAERPVHGVVESVVLYLDEPHTVRAKLDTGADSSSLHAEIIERFERDGHTWLRVHTRLANSALKMERPLIDEVRIKGKGAGASLRPVIELDFCIGRQRLSAPFNLVDRSRFSTPVLLGRDVLSRIGPVDAAARDTRAPECASPYSNTR